MSIFSIHKQMFIFFWSNYADMRMSNGSKEGCGPLPGFSYVVDGGLIVLGH